VVRDIFSAHFERAIVDDDKQHERLISFFSRTAPELVDRVELFKDEGVGVFDAYGVEPVIQGMLNRRVDLPSGGYLMIDYAEALTVIDINTGSFTGKGKQARLEDTITKTNLEAAEEVVRQLRLRDIGGIIVIDFIDMARARNRNAVLDVLRKALDEDRTKTFVVEISPLGLVEMTRQNVTDGVREIMTKHCPTCDGEGVVKSEETIAIEVGRKLRELVAAAGDAAPEAYLVRLNPKVTHVFTGDGGWLLEGLEQETGRTFLFEGSDGLELDHFSVTQEGTREEITTVAVPFGVGDEVHVELVEPHMYEADDAVAKIDGYVIDVVNGLGFVGEKKLVCIEEAGRNGARAVLLGEDADVAAAAAAERAKEREKAAKTAARRPSTRRKATAPATPTGVDAAPAADATAVAEGEEAAAMDAAAAGAPGVVSALHEPVDDPGAADAETAAAGDEDEGDESLQSRSRRRGRRGGRRRSRAKTATDGEAGAAEVSEASE
jgi:ribonuclease G